MAVVGSHATLCAVDNTAQIIAKTMGGIIQRGIGNYIMLAIFCLIASVAMKDFVEEKLENSILVRKLTFEDEIGD